MTQITNQQHVAARLPQFLNLYQSLPKEQQEEFKPLLEQLKQAQRVSQLYLIANPILAASEKILGKAEAMNILFPNQQE
ncbi:hypothetical protein DZC41_13765 [Acinetobacter haemolyticus]|nr:hypothetical protein [Acinetobacter haemolyticus]